MRAIYKVWKIDSIMSSLKKSLYRSHQQINKRLVRNWKLVGFRDALQRTYDGLWGKVEKLMDPSQPDENHWELLIFNSLYFFSLINFILCMCGYRGQGQLAGVKLRFDNQRSYPLNHLSGPCTSALLLSISSIEDISYKCGVWDHRMLISRPYSNA